uniref:Si:ch211-182p11.1 n=1 Tax=Cyprinus carpio carpio TaxID=630221 RepID=A0A8C1AZ87_CYPCA
MRISQHLLVFISVLSLTRVQTATVAATALESTVAPAGNNATKNATTSAPAIFYPFRSAAGDTEHFLTGDESYESVALSTPYTFFGRTYNSLYVHYNGLLTFNQPEPASGPNYNPTRGAEDFIAPLWSDLDDMGWMGMFSYQQYTNGSVLTRATQDINQYFPQMNFTASWVFVVTWDYVDAVDMNSFIHHSGQAITFQVVLISNGSLSFFLINYGDCAVIYDQVEAGYDTINSIDQDLFSRGLSSSIKMKLREVKKTAVTSASFMEGN